MEKKTKTIYIAHDGREFEWKNACKRYDRIAKMNREIDNLAKDKKIADFLKDNWRDIKRLALKYSNIFPHEKVKDEKIIHKKKDN